MWDTKKQIVLCEDMLNTQMYYVLKTGRHVTLTGIMYKLRRMHFNILEAAHAINHMKDATNIAPHILKVSCHID